MISDCTFFNKMESESTYNYWIKLSKAQIKEFHDIFVKEFWFHSSISYVDKTRKDKGIHLIKEVKERFEKSLNYDPKYLIRNDEIAGFLDMELTNGEVTELVLPEISYDSFEFTQILAKAKEVMLDVNNFYSFFIDTDIPGSIYLGNPIIGMVAGEDGHFVFSDKISLKVTKKQFDQLRNKLETKWKYNDMLPIKDISEKFFLNSEAKSSKINVREIQEVHEVDLGELELGNFKEYLDEMNKPESERKCPPLPEDHYYARRVVFKWKLLPPTLPKNARRHEIYEKWPKLFPLLEKQYQSLEKHINEITAIIAKEKEPSKIKEIKKSAEKLQSKLKNDSKALSKKFTELSSLGERFKEDPRIIDENRAPELKTWIAGLNKTVEETFQLLLTLSELIKKNEKKLLPELNEIEMSDKKKLRLSKEMKKLVKLCENIQKMNSSQFKISEKAIPHYPVPRVGELFTVKGQNIIGIQSIDEIQIGYEEGKKYESAKLVWRK